MMAERSYCGKVDIKCRDCGCKIERSRVIFVIIAITKLLNLVILKKITPTLRRLIFYLDYWLIERTSF